MTISNRLGFAVLGLTNNFAYVIMLSAAYDLLNKSSSPQPPPIRQDINPSTSILEANIITSTLAAQLQSPTNDSQQKYCNEHSTSTILLADTLPSLTTKIFYPFLLVGIPTAYKAIATAILSAIAFIMTGLSTNQVLIFTGVVCASFSSGLGEATYLSNTPLYGDASLSGWSMGTGAAGLVGAAAYALLRMVLPIKVIMVIMLVIPIAMMAAYLYLIKPVKEDIMDCVTRQRLVMGSVDALVTSSEITSSRQEEAPLKVDSPRVRGYGSAGASDDSQRIVALDAAIIINKNNSSPVTHTCLSQEFNFQAKLRCLPSLAKYFLPLLLVYFAEYFINQGLFELVYYPEITFIDHAAQYRWFQVSYQVGVMISRSSLDIIQIKSIWTMSLLQTANALLFLAHVSKLIHIPSFYVVILIIIYEGLLGGFTYVNAFYRVKKEVAPGRQEFCISTVTTADSLGIVMAGLVALPVHDTLCKLYI